MSPTNTILVVDDDSPTRTVLRDLVERAGPFAVLEAEDGRQALELARRHEPDLVLLDLMMPDRSGYEVCADLRQDRALREVPIVVLSAADHADATVKALEAGADDFLRKPCDIAELRAKIGTIMRLNRFRKLAGERERFRWLVDRSLEPLIITNTAGRLVFANARAREVFGLAEGDGCDVATAIGRHFECEPADAWSDLRTRGFRTGASFALVQPENEHIAARWFDVEVQPTAEGAGEVLLKFTDQTRNVRRELETWTFQHMIFHKFRTPLNGLGNVLDLVADLQGSKLDPEAASLLQVAQESARRLEHTILDVLAYHEALFRPTAGSKGTATALRDVIKTAATETGLMTVTFEPAAAWDDPAAEALPLRAVLTEVCENYAKFSAATDSGLTATLAEAVTGELELRLFAPGPVPPPEVLAQLGRPYWQVQRHYTGEMPGMGLGLATARLLLRSHGGDLRLSAGRAMLGVLTTIVLPRRGRTELRAVEAAVA